MTARVRAVVVNWNGRHLLERCLDSLLAQDLPQGDVEVVLVDNASTDGSVELVRSTYPGVRIVETHENLGFAGGVNAGLDALEAPFVALLNNDAVFEPAALRLLLDHLDRPENARVGAASARILLTQTDERGRTLVNSTGNVLTPTGAATDRDWLVVAGSDDDDAPLDVFGFCGGAAVLRTQTLDEVGLFDAGLFLYYEDTDLSWRMRAAGWDIHYVAEAVAHHEHAASSDSTSALFRYYNTRNSLLVLARHAPVGPVLRSALRQTAAWARYSLTRAEGSELLRARRRALRDVVRALPATARRRRSTWAGRPALRRAVYRSAVRAPRS